MLVGRLCSAEIVLEKIQLNEVNTTYNHDELFISLKLHSMIHNRCLPHNSMSQIQKKAVPLSSSPFQKTRTIHQKKSYHQRPVTLKWILCPQGSGMTATHATLPLRSESTIAPSPGLRSVLIHRTSFSDSRSV
jgi:hypothetical protein